VPGEVFVVAGVAAEAAVEDADQPVREGAEGLVVGGAPTVEHLVTGVVRTGPARGRLGLVTSSDISGR
jgi:hypothetical protein